MRYSIVLWRPAPNHFLAEWVAGGIVGGDCHQRESLAVSFDYERGLDDAICGQVVAGLDLRCAVAIDVADLLENPCLEAFGEIAIVDALTRLFLRSYRSLEYSEIRRSRT
jgi:hypothetical protein